MRSNKHWTVQQGIGVLGISDCVDVVLSFDYMLPKTAALIRSRFRDWYALSNNDMAVMQSWPHINWQHVLNGAKDDDSAIM
jgi:hypothetical protein